MVKDSSSSTIKKKRKASHAEAVPESDIYKKVIEFEEKESASRQSSIDANLYFELNQDIRNLLSEVLELRLNDPTSKKLKDLQTEIFIKMCFIKKLNRADKIRHVFGKETLAQEKQKCDSIKLNYQNLVYELHHLVTEANKCLAFKSQDEEIELVSFEEFMKEAPESLSKKFQTFDPNDRAQKHSLCLSRLEWELTQRKTLAQLYKSLVGEQKKLAQEIIEKRDKLNALHPLLLNIINSTKPLQEHLDISLTDMRIEHKLAYLLPDPLYIFYVNMVSYKNVYDLKMDVEIIGEQEEAAQWKEPVQEGNLFNDEESETDVGEVEEVVEVKKRRHRKSVQQVDPMEEKRRKLLETHPLKVQIVAKVIDDVSLTITFSYQVRLKIITVISQSTIPSKITGNCARDVLVGENLLSELLPGDTGIESPNPVNKFQIKKVGVSSFQSLVSHTGFAYYWAQKMCGMDFLSKKMNSDEVSSSSVEKVMQLLIKRLGVRVDLANQLQQLEQNVLPKLPESADCPSTSTCSLSKWSSISYQQYCQKEHARTFIEEEMVTSSDLFYSLQLTRGNAALDALIAVKSNYPQILPIFSLCVKQNGLKNAKNDTIREMERLLNVELGTSVSSALSIQIARLRSYFDLYLETMDSKAFPQTVTFIKRISGRNRKRPLKYRNMGNGIFTHY